MFFWKNKYPFIKAICRYEAISNACSFNENTGYETLVRTSATHAQAFFIDGDKQIPLVRKSGYICAGKWDKTLSGTTIDWPLSYFIDKVHFESNNLAKLLEADYLTRKDER